MHNDEFNFVNSKVMHMDDLTQQKDRLSPDKRKEFEKWENIYRVQRDLPRGLRDTTARHEAYIRMQHLVNNKH